MNELPAKESECRSREGQAMNGLVSRLIYPGASRSVDVGQVERTLQPGEELVWQETARDERIGLIIRPPGPQAAVDRILLWKRGSSS